MDNSPALKVSLLVALLAGCAQQEPTSGVEEGPKHDKYVREVVLSDGTRCAVYSGYKKGGITCDWK